MKSSHTSYLSLTVFVLFFPLLAFSQIVQSFCSGPTSLQNQYMEDAWNVAYESLLENDSANFSNTIPIPVEAKNAVLAGILGIYNADLPARDTVFQQFDIHHHAEIDLQRIEVYVDTLFPWAKAFAFGNMSNTGNYYVDSLANLYGFTLENVIWLPQWVTEYNAVVSVRINQHANTNLLAQVMTGFSGVKFANAYTFGGDGNGIFYNPKDSFAEVSFRYGWEDCPSGCLFHREWLFRVYDDCRVEFVASYGDALGSSPTFAPQNTALNIALAPNPTYGRVDLSVPPQQSQAVLYTRLLDTH